MIQNYLKDFKEVEKIYNLCREAFYSADIKLTFKIVKELKVYEKKYPELIRFINRHLENLIIHQKDSAIKKTNNLAENINRRLMIRLKTIESFNSIRNADFTD